MCVFQHGERERREAKVERLCKAARIFPSTILMYYNASNSEIRVILNLFERCENYVCVVCVFLNMEREREGRPKSKGCAKLQECSETQFQCSTMLQFLKSE